MEGQLPPTKPAPVEVTAGGRTLVLSPRDINDYAEEGRRILAALPSPLAAVAGQLDGLTDAQAKYVLGLAYDETRQHQSWTFGQIMAFDATPEGRACAVWLSARHADPSLLESDVATWLGTLSVAETVKVVDALERAEGHLKN